MQAILFSKKKYNNNRGVILSGILYLAILVFFLLVLSSITKSNTMNDKRILEEALQRDIVHCYALEGMYPPSVSYMEEHYGLTYDKEKYIVNYENVGSNIMPTVMIIER